MGFFTVPIKRAWRGSSLAVVLWVHPSRTKPAKRLKSAFLCLFIGILLPLRPDLAISEQSTTIETSVFIHTSIINPSMEAQRVPHRYGRIILIHGNNTAKTARMIMSRYTIGSYIT
jgi:hypothetical protein